MPPSKSLTVHAKSVIAVCVVLVVFVALCHSVTWRDRNIAAERFVDTVNISAVKSIKSDRYAAAGMSNFYSDGTPMQSAIFFRPSTNDILCKMGSDEVMSECTDSKTRIDNVSCSDDTTLLSTAYNCSRSVNATSKVPVERDDCKVRILDGMYTFVKSCVTLTARGVPGNLDAVELLASGYGTRVMMLMRPVFIAGPLCKLSAPVYAPSSYPNTVTTYDSASQSNAILLKKDVTDNAISDGTGMDLSSLMDMIRNSGKAAGTPSSDSSVEVPMTMYYLNYLSHIDGSFGNQQVITLYLRTDKVLSSMFSMQSPLFSIGFAVDANNQRVCSVTTGKGRYTIPAPDSGVLVVTYATNLLIMCMISQSRVCMNTYGGQPLMSASPADAQQAVVTHPPPPQVYPYDNTCIPNFADIAIKYGFL